MGWFDRAENSSGAIAGRLSTDTLYIRGAVGDQLGMIMQNLVTVVAAYVIAFSAGWKMTLVISATVPLIAAGAWIEASFMMGLTTKVQCCAVLCCAMHTTLPYGGSIKPASRWAPGTMPCYATL